MSSWVTLITNEWRLKLLAFVLAVLMLGAVAFSQNPPTIKAITVGLNYNVKDGLVLINPPSKTTVSVSGLADVIARVDPDSNLIATVDASNASAGQAVKMKIQATTTVRGVTITQPAPIAVNVDTRTLKEVPVQVGARAAPGWSITKAVATCPGSVTPDPCRVHFDGPASWETNLIAVATLPGSNVSATTIDSPSQRIQLGNSSGSLDIAAIRTIPSAALDVTSVNLHVEAVAGVTSSTVPLLDAAPSHGPPTGYRVTAVTISPLTVVISGDPTAVNRNRNIVLPAVDLSSSRSDVTFQLNITYPNGVSGQIETATVKYSIARNPNVT
jgi:YbbR domain-containing protein